MHSTTSCMRKLEEKSKSAKKSTALLQMSASWSANIFFTGEREWKRVHFFGKERDRVREIEERANALTKVQFPSIFYFSSLFFSSS